MPKVNISDAKVKQSLSRCVENTFYCLCKKKALAKRRNTEKNTTKK